jgi:hypothetical protein
VLTGACAALPLGDDHGLPHGWIFELRLTQLEAASEPGRYDGSLWLDAPYLLQEGRGWIEGPERLDLRARLAPGEQASFLFRPLAPVHHARLELHLDGEALTAVDLFAGELNTRPFESLAEMNLSAALAAVCDQGGYREPQAVWLGAHPPPQW